MFCRVGSFHWSLALDGHCPNHGSVNRHGRTRGNGDHSCDENGPHDANGVHYLDCCSVPEVKMHYYETTMSAEVDIGAILTRKTETADALLKEAV